MEKAVYTITVRNWSGVIMPGEQTEFRSANQSEAMGEALAILAQVADEDLTVVAFTNRIKYTRKGEFRVATVKCS